MGYLASSIGQSLLANMFGGDDYQKYSNGTYDPVKGGFVNPQTGEVSPVPYSRPGFATRVFNPNLSGQLIGQDMAWQNRPALAQQEQGTERGLASSNFTSLDPSIQAAYGNDPSRYYAETHGAPTGDATAFNAAQNEAKARQQLSANSFRQAAMSGLLGNPEQAATTENAGQGYQQNLYNSENALLPAKTQLEGQQIGNESSNLSTVAPLARQEDAARLGGLIASQPYVNQDSLNAAKMGALTSGQDLGNAGTLLGTRQNEMYGANVKSQFPLGIDPHMPWAAQLQSDGSVGMGPNTLSPYISLMGATGSNEQMAPVGNGLNMKLTPQQSVQPTRIPIGDGYHVDQNTGAVGYQDRQGNSNPNPITTDKTEQDAQDAMKEQQDAAIDKHKSALRIQQNQLALKTLIADHLKFHTPIQSSNANY